MSVLKAMIYLPWQNSQNASQNPHKPELSRSHRILQNPERILESETCDTETVVEKRKQKVEKHGEQYRTPVNDRLR
jgi:hypothetical protein